MAASAPEQSTAWPRSGHVRVAVLGAGFSGLAVGNALRGIGVDDFVILDRGTTVGGTWRDNTYPGCGCDVASHLYSFSFAPNPTWSRSYSLQPEIRAYLEDVARERDLERHLALGVELSEATWDEATARWRLDTSNGELQADVFVTAGGPLSAPVTPDLPGLAEFPGPVFHSAQWRHDVDLAGKRVGVVGTGASAVQLVPEIQPTAGRLTVFQRTPPWVLPKGDRAITPLEHRMYRRFPGLQRAVRAGHYAFRESIVPAFVLLPALMKVAEAVSRWQINRQIKDPALRAAVTPEYRLGCKRVLPANGYYPALEQFNTELVPHGLVGFEGGTAIAADGSRHDLDVVIFGTGFQVTDLPIAHHLVGRDGRRMSDDLAREGGSALRCTTVSGYPNLFMMLGPNSGLGHSSMVYVIESQVAYVVDAIKAMAAGRLASLEPTRDAQERYNATLQRRMKRTVWNTGGCRSWYQDEHGKVTALWPGSTFRLRRDTRAIDLREYETHLLGPELARTRAAGHRPAPQDQELAPEGA